MLLVPRDTTIVKPTNGSVRQHEPMLDWLLQPRVVLPDSIAHPLPKLHQLEELLILDEEDRIAVEHQARFNSSEPDKEVLAFWSGKRSVVIRDETTGTWYKLKGIGFDPENLKKRRDRHSIDGSQKAINAHLEWEMSERFNRVLEAEGIAPVMHVRGSWHYPGRIGGMRPTATIIEVKGDTRLDELWSMLFLNQMKFIYESALLALDRYRTLAQHLYHDTGYVVGHLKKVMNKSGQVWGTNGKQTNANTGNIIIFPEEGRLKLGLVDFDISADTRYYTQSQLEELQIREMCNILATAKGKPDGMRHLFYGYGGIHRRLSQGQMDGDVQPQFMKGFRKGYQYKGTVPPSVDFGLLYEMGMLVRNTPKKERGEDGLPLVSYSGSM